MRVNFYKYVISVTYCVKQLLDINLPVNVNLLRIHELFVI